MALLFMLAACVTDPKKDGHIYDTNFGQVYCGSMYPWECGLHLWNCHDGHEYICMTNVRERGE